MIDNTIVRQTRCGVCLQKRTLTQPIEGLASVETCHACAKTIQVGIGFLEREGIQILASSDVLNTNTGQLTSKDPESSKK